MTCFYFRLIPYLWHTKIKKKHIVIHDRDHLAFTNFSSVPKTTAKTSYKLSRHETNDNVRKKYPTDMGVKNGSLKSNRNIKFYVYSFEKLHFRSDGAAGWKIYYIKLLHYQIIRGKTPKGTQRRKARNSYFS